MLQTIFNFIRWIDDYIFSSIESVCHKIQKAVGIDCIKVTFLFGLASVAIIWFLDNMYPAQDTQLSSWGMYIELTVIAIILLYYKSKVPVILSNAQKGLMNPIAKHEFILYMRRFWIALLTLLYLPMLIIEISLIAMSLHTTTSWNHIMEIALRNTVLMLIAVTPLPSSESKIRQWLNSLKASLSAKTAQQPS